MKRGRKSKRSRKKLKSENKSKKHSRTHHHIKLITLLTSKIIFVFIAFVIGIYAGKFIENTFIVLLVAVIIASTIYLISIIHMIKLLKL